MKISYNTHYKSKRPDGRHVSTMAAHMAWLRDFKPELSMPDNLTYDEFLNWKEKVREKVKQLLCMPEFSVQPDPKLLSRIKRNAYTVEKWEFYPDDYTAVPFLMLIPNGVTKKNPAPGVICLPGSVHSKEFISGEPLLPGAACRFEKYPERNRMALYMVKAGMVAFAFDNPETAECALEIERDNDWGYTSREQMCHGLIQSGLCYAGVSVFQKLAFMKFLKRLDFVDQTRLAVSAHSLGATDALFLGILRDEFKAVVFNDFVCDERHRYVSTTEYDETKMCNNNGNWHEIPGIFRYFSRTDLLGALAPKYLSLNEGGAEVYLDKVRAAYSVNYASDRLWISHYPKYSDADIRSKIYDAPMYGLSSDAYFEFNNVDASDHSFRKDTSVDFLKTVFFGK